jgi:hypothetical protein
VKCNWLGFELPKANKLTWKLYNCRKWNYFESFIPKRMVLGGLRTSGNARSWRFHGTKRSIKDVRIKRFFLRHPQRNLCEEQKQTAKNILLGWDHRFFVYAKNIERKSSFFSLFIFESGSEAPTYIAIYHFLLNLIRHHQNFLMSRDFAKK